MKKSKRAELHAPVKLNVTQELSQKEAAITYSTKLYSGKGGCWILAQAKAALGFLPTPATSSARWSHQKEAAQPWVLPCPDPAALQY